MKRVLCKKLPRSGHPTRLEENEALHLTRVLRLREGAEVEVIDGMGHGAVGRLSRRGEHIEIEYLHDIEAKQELLPIILALSILKGDAMEWAIEKAVELGAQSVVPIISAHTIVQLGKKGPEPFRDRWQKIADQALKQCGRLKALEIKLPIQLAGLISRPGCTVWCDESERNQLPHFKAWLDSAKPDSLQILIGPEGGWNPLERDLLEKIGIPVSLGPLVLRAETAAITTLAIAAGYFRTQ